MAKVGDIYKIQLSDRRWAYGQYAFRDKFGPIVQIFEQITEVEIPLSDIITTKLLFRPLIMGLFAAIKVNLFQKIGFLPLEDFKYPRFISTAYNEKTGKAGVWYLWNGEKRIRIGNDLLSEYKKYEFLFVWSPYDVINRIETGYYPVIYKELIQYNKFQPNPEK